MARSREPMRHTCPDIDRYILNIKSTIVRRDYIDRLDEADLKDLCDTMNSQLSDCIDYLEEQRTANDTLRRWGIDEADRVDELENQINDLENKIGELEENK